MECVLRPRVGPGKGSPGLARGARHDRDGAAAVGDQVREDEPGQVDDGEDVEVEHVLVHLDVDLLPLGPLTLARVVEHDVKLQFPRSVVSLSKVENPHDGPSRRLLGLGRRNMEKD